MKPTLTNHGLAILGWRLAGGAMDTAKMQGISVNNPVAFRRSLASTFVNGFQAAMVLMEEGADLDAIDLASVPRAGLLASLEGCNEAGKPGKPGSAN